MELIISRQLILREVFENIRGCFWFYSLYSSRLWMPLTITYMITSKMLWEEKALLDDDKPRRISLIPPFMIAGSSVVRKRSTWTPQTNSIFNWQIHYHKGNIHHASISVSFDGIVDIKFLKESQIEFSQSWKAKISTAEMHPIFADQDLSPNQKFDLCG